MASFAPTMFAGLAADIVKLAEAVRQPEFHNGIRFIAFGFAKIGMAPEGNPRVALLVIEPRPGTTQRAVDGGPLVPRIQRFDRRIPVPWTAADPPIFITGLPAEIGAVGDQTCGESVSTPEQIGMEHGEPTSNSRFPTEVSSHLSTESPIRKQAEGLRLSTRPVGEQTFVLGQDGELPDRVGQGIPHVLREGENGVMPGFVDIAGVSLCRLRWGKSCPTAGAASAVNTSVRMSDRRFIADRPFLILIGLLSTPRARRSGHRPGGARNCHPAAWAGARACPAARSCKGSCSAGG